ncbi:FMN-binding protein [Erysipelatoclostridium ramosum]|nr:FMN-binding protein [Thomasclavelia ramosa]
MAVDDVSSATISIRAIRMAAQNALKKAEQPQ